MIIEILVFFFYQRFFQQRGNFIRFGFHSPLFVARKVSVNDFVLVVGDDGRIFRRSWERKNEMQAKEKDKYACDAIQKQGYIFQYCLLSKFHNQQESQKSFY